MKAKRPLIIMVPCRRCGKKLASSTRHEQTALYLELGRICECCITSEEDRRLLEETGGMLYRKITGVGI